MRALHHPLQVPDLDPRGLARERGAQETLDQITSDLPDLTGAEAQLLRQLSIANVAAVLCVGLGCEAFKPDQARAAIERFGKPVRAIAMHSAGGYLATVERGAALVRELTAEVAGLRREPVDRVGLFEVMEITEGIRDLIMVGATAVEIKRKALEEGMLTLRMSGLEKIKSGVTTVEEVLRETVL